MMGTKIKIVSSDGHIWDTQFESTFTIQNIKQKSIERFYSPDLTTNMADDFKVIYPEGLRSLVDTHQIQEEKLKDNDVLLLVRRRKILFSDVIHDSDLKSPTKEQIMAATKNMGGISHLPPTIEDTTSISSQTSGSSTKPRHGGVECALDEAVDFQLDLRKIIISLLTKMTTMLRGDPNVDIICNQMKIKIKKRFINAQKVLDETTIVLPPPPEIICTPLGIVNGLIEAKKREFHPNSKAYDALKELGFLEDEIMDGLRGNKNNKDLTLEWLLSENRIIIDDVNTGLNPSSHLFQTLVENPVIRLGLHNPKTILAFLEILESSNNASIWLSDPVMSPVLASVFKIYHAEKHAVRE